MAASDLVFAEVLVAIVAMLPMPVSNLLAIITKTAMCVTV